MNNVRTKNPLLVTEIVFSLLVFMFFSVFCVKAFTGAKLRSYNAEMLYRAVTDASDMAECFKAANGDTLKTAEILGTKTADDFSVSFTDGKLTVKLIITGISTNSAGKLILAQITVTAEEPDGTLSDIYTINVGEAVLNE